MVRLYETTDPDLVAKITDATNTQSPINFRDKLSTKLFNSYVKSLFESHDIGYLTKRGDTFENSLSLALNESIHADHLLKFWYATYQEKPDVAKNSKARVLEEIFDATTDTTHPLYPLFSGHPDSPLYQQLLHVYKLYRYVVDQRNQRQQGTELLFYADELICYALYKLDSDDLASGYETILSALHQISDTEKKLLATKELTYSHLTYFKSARSKYDLDRVLGFVGRERV